MSGCLLLQVERKEARLHGEDTSVLQLLEHRHSFAQDMQSKIKGATQYIRVCFGISPEQLQRIALIRC
jgi:hypothetical protein